MTLPSRRNSLIRALTILSPVVFHDELSRELRSSSPNGLGCMENITSDMASFAESVSTGTVRWGFPSEVNSKQLYMTMIVTASIILNSRVTTIRDNEGVYKYYPKS